MLRASFGNGYTGILESDEAALPVKVLVVTSTC